MPDKDSVYTIPNIPDPIVKLDDGHIKFFRSKGVSLLSFIVFRKTVDASDLGVEGSFRFSTATLQKAFGVESNAALAEQMKSFKTVDRVLEKLSSISEA